MAVKKKKKVVKKAAKVKKLPAKKLTLRTEKDIAADFAEKVYKKFDRIVKSVILFGSQAKSTSTTGSDIDVVIVIDDASINWDMELIAWYREELARIVSEQDYGRDLHINTIRLTTWWHDLMHGDPVVINIIRYGEALIDYAGFFNPVKALLVQGQMRSTPEAVHAALRRAPAHIMRSKQAEMGAVEGAYWSMVDSAQAALMTAGKMPPSPEKIPEMLKENFVDNGMLKMNFVRAMKDLSALHKSIVHGEINDIQGKIIDNWQDVSERFLQEMTRIIDALLEKTD